MPEAISNSRIAVRMRPRSGEHGSTHENGGLGPPYAKLLESTPGCDGRLVPYQLKDKSARTWRVSCSEAEARSPVKEHELRFR